MVSLAEEMQEAKMQAKGRDAGLSAQLAAETRSRATHLLMQPRSWTAVAKQQLKQTKHQETVWSLISDPYRCLAWPGTRLSHSHSQV